MARTSEIENSHRPQKSTGRNLVVLCDGTANELGSALAANADEIRISNVLKFYRIVAKRKNQIVYYSPGVGTIGRVDFYFRWKQKFLSLLGLVTGYGLDDNVISAYRFLAENWREGDRIYLLGFSRGAWTVRVLAGLIHLIGLVRPAQLNMCDSALATYKRAAREGKLPIAWHFARVIGARFPTIHFIGVWDTVASVLVPREDRMWIPSLETLPYTMTNPSVRIFRHALALDERRRMFRVAAWTQPQPFVSNRFQPAEIIEQDIEQRWFPGVHADIGGGYPESESSLSKQPLIWMTEEARKAGMYITEGNLKKFALGQEGSNEDHSYSDPNFAGQMHNSMTFAWKPLEFLPKSIKHREWPQRPSIFGLYLPLSEPRPISDAHSVDRSVDQRRLAGIGYEPVQFPR